MGDSNFKTITLNIMFLLLFWHSFYSTGKPQWINQKYDLQNSIGIELCLNYNKSGFSVKIRFILLSLKLVILN